MGVGQVPLPPLSNAPRNAQGKDIHPAKRKEQPEQSDRLRYNLHLKWVTCRLRKTECAEEAIHLRHPRANESKLPNCLSQTVR